MEGRRQVGLQVNPAIIEAERSMTYPMRGIVEAVRYRDTGRGRRTVVDVLLLDRTGQTTPDYRQKLLTHVPLKYTKMNAANGEEWSPEKGDLVVVEFFNANLADPFVSGCLGPYDGAVMDPGTDPHPQAFRKRSGTWERIDKDGNRQTEVAADEALEVKGQRTTIIKGNETVTITSGDVTVDVSAGKVTVTVAGKIAYTGAGIDHDGGGGSMAGNVQGECICAYTRKKHPMASATVKSTL